MAYTPTTWSDGQTKLGPTNLNHLETGLQTAAAVADAAVPKSTVTTTQDLIVASGNAAVTRLGVGAAGQVLAVVGGVLTWVYPSGYQIGYDQITAPVTVTSGTEATGTTVIACAAHTFDGSPVRAEFFSPSVRVAAAETLIVSLFEGAAQIGRLALGNAPAASFTDAPFFGSLPFTPSATAHTYTVTASKGASNCIVNAGTSGTGAFGPCFVRFVKV